jgi:hypothetical protein
VNPLYCTYPGKNARDDARVHHLRQSVELTLGMTDLPLDHDHVHELRPARSEFVYSVQQLQLVPIPKMRGLSVCL